ncbi:Uncharacterised protein [Mycobacteroides abscessus subsp. abscessus]|nr:Uncharacterised protein [Mycobacteroides abscessus subsp. abscessus]
MMANWMLSSPRTLTPSAIARVAVRTRSRTSSPRVSEGSTHAESPEWMPASSMCSMMPPMKMSSPS